MSRLRPHLFTAWLVALLCVPAVAWAVGARQPELENRAKAPMPELDGRTLLEAATYDALEAAIRDRLPLRDRALDADVRMRLDVFGDSSNAEVEFGRNGWIYLVTELQPCLAGHQPTVDPVEMVEVVARSLRASGRQVAIVATESKLTMHPDDAPALEQEHERCLRDLERRLAAKLERLDVDLGVLRELRRLERAGIPVFLKKDTHWNVRGREVFVRAVFDWVRPGLARDARVRVGRVVERPGDFGNLLGARVAENDRIIEADRPKRPVPRGSVAVLGDSYVEDAFFREHASGVPTVGELALPGTSACPVVHLSRGACDARIRRARSVLLEFVGRNINAVAEGCWRIVRVASEGATGTKASWQRVDGEPVGTGGLTVEAGGAVVVRIRPRGPDVAASTRLFRIPVIRDGESAASLAQELGPLPPVPCATPTTELRGGLLVPVPAGRAVSEIVLRLESPSLTVFGAPEEIDLGR